jgi:transcription initiation factor TFIIIB Brf1 subunit/transcription initiation factor TFIIB
VHEQSLATFDDCNIEFPTDLAPAWQLMKQISMVKAELTVPIALQTIKILQEWLELSGKKDAIVTDSMAYNLYIGGSLLAAYNQNNLTFSFKSISFALCVPKAKLVAAYSEVINMLRSHTICPNDLRSLVIYITNALQIPKQITQLCLDSVFKIATVLSGKNARSIAAVTVFAMASEYNLEITRKDLSVISGISDVTLWSLLKILNDRRALIDLPRADPSIKAEIEASKGI